MICEIFSSILILELQPSSLVHLNGTADRVRLTAASSKRFFDLFTIQCPYNQ